MLLSFGMFYLLAQTKRWRRLECSDFLPLCASIAYCKLNVASAKCALQCAIVWTHCKKCDKSKTSEGMAWVMKQKDHANLERFISSERWGFL